MKTFEIYVYKGSTYSHTLVREEIKMASLMLLQTLPSGKFQYSFQSSLDGLQNRSEYEGEKKNVYPAAVRVQIQAVHLAA